MSAKNIASLKHLKSTLSNKYFSKNLALLIGVVLLLFLICSNIVNNNAKKILENELLASDKNYIEVISNSVDSTLMDMRYIVATLDTDNVVNTFFRSASPDSIISDIYVRLQEKLVGYVNSYSCIHSIYLYSEKSDLIITQDGISLAQNFTDLEWINHFTDNPESYVLLTRSYNGVYPDFLSVMKQIKIGNSNAAIVLNMVIKEIPILAEIEQNHSDIYLINDNSQVLYHADQRLLLEPLTISDKLSSFSTDVSECAFISTDKNNSYAYTQLHSDEYDFSYVLITNLTEYSQELFSRQTIFLTLFIGLFLVIVLLTFIMALRFFMPLEMLTRLLDGSSDLIENTHYHSQEISDLAQKIISYAQVNKQLADELAISLQNLSRSQILALQAQVSPHFLFNTLSIIHIKECQELGYSHPLPAATLSLSRILRYAIDSTDIVPLRTELDYIKLYIQILHFRDMQKISITYEIDPTLLDTLVPKLFIQPLIENIFLHAFSEDEQQDNHMQLSIQRDDENCVVTLTDNGVGMTSEKCSEIIHYLDEISLPSSSIGIRNVINRLQLIYGENFHLDLQSTIGKGTVFCLVFPIKSN